MRSKYLSGRAIGLHLALLAWVAMCVVCAVWQVGRAIQGNSLSFMYSIEWPVFAVFGVMGWYALLNMERVSEHQEKARREYEDKMRADALAARDDVEEDPTLAAYNDHLETLSHQPKKRLWGHS